MSDGIVTVWFRCAECDGELRFLHRKGNHYYFCPNCLKFLGKFHPEQDPRVTI